MTASSFEFLRRHLLILRPFFVLSVYSSPSNILCAVDNICADSIIILHTCLSQLIRAATTGSLSKKNIFIIRILYQEFNDLSSTKLWLFFNNYSSSIYVLLWFFGRFSSIFVPVHHLIHFDSYLIWI